MGGQMLPDKGFTQGGMGRRGHPKMLFKGTAKGTGIGIPHPCSCHIDEYPRTEHAEGGDQPIANSPLLEGEARFHSKSPLQGPFREMHRFGEFS